MLFDLQIFSGSVHPPSATSRAISFLFPIVFGTIAKDTQVFLLLRGGSRRGRGGRAPPPREKKKVVDLLLRACTWHAAGECTRAAVGQRPYQRYRT